MLFGRFAKQVRHADLTLRRGVRLGGHRAFGACDLLRPQNDPLKDIARKATAQPELFLVAEAEKKRRQLDV